MPPRDFAFQAKSLRGQKTRKFVTKQGHRHLWSQITMTKRNKWKNLPKTYCSLDVICFNFCKGKNVCLYYTKKQANVLKNVSLRLRGGKDVKNLQMFWMNIKHLLKSAFGWYKELCRSVTSAIWTPSSICMMNYFYYSFKIFLRFWLAKIPRIIHIISYCWPNLEEFAVLSWWRQSCSKIDR